MTLKSTTVVIPLGQFVQFWKFISQIEDKRFLCTFLSKNKSVLPIIDTASWFQKSMVNRGCNLHFLYHIEPYATSNSSDFSLTEIRQGEGPWIKKYSDVKTNDWIV